MTAPLSQSYSLFPGSVITWLGDNSGIAIYNGYNGDTHFLNAITDYAEQAAPANTHTSFTQADLMTWLGIDETRAAHVIKQLISQRVLWKDCQ